MWWCLKKGPRWYLPLQWSPFTLASTWASAKFLVGKVRVRGSMWHSSPPSHSTTVLNPPKTWTSSHEVMSPLSLGSIAGWIQVFCDGAKISGGITVQVTIRVAIMLKTRLVLDRCEKLEAMGIRCCIWYGKYLTLILQVCAGFGHEVKAPTHLRCLEFLLLWKSNGRIFLHHPQKCPSLHLLQWLNRAFYRHGLTLFVTLCSGANVVFHGSYQLISMKTW